MQLLGLPSIDARDEYVGKTLKGCAYSYRKSADGKQRPVSQVLLVHDFDTEFVVHIFQSDADPQLWFKDLCFHIDGRDELCTQIPEIRFRVNRKSKKGSEGRAGLHAIPAPLADQTQEMQAFLKDLPGASVELELPLFKNQRTSPKSLTKSRGSQRKKRIAASATNVHVVEKIQN